MDIFVARQPILDRNKDLYAYELLFRSGKSGAFPNIDGNTATTSLLSSSFFTIGIDKLTGGKLAFINFTEDLIKEGTPLLFPNKKLMVEILEDVEPNEQILSSCKELKEKGYLLALDDFVYSKKFDKLIELSDIIKIDFRLTPLDTIEEMVPSLEKSGCKLLAEKIETHEEFEKACSLGFDYFQGYFFAKPEVVADKDLSSSQLTMMQLISSANSDEFDIAGLEEIVSLDVSTSYKLITYLNSPHFGRIQPISSIRQAISFLGEKGFKLFISLIATTNLAADKPQELVKMSIIRARFLELVGNREKINGNELFLLGLFSKVDAMLDKSMDEILLQLPIAPDIKEALQVRAGSLFIYLRLVEAYESGNWLAFQYVIKRTSLTETEITEFYIEALEWADSFEDIS